MAYAAMTRQKNASRMLALRAREGDGVRGDDASEKRQLEAGATGARAEEGFFDCVRRRPLRRTGNTAGALRSE